MLNTAPGIKRCFHYNDFIPSKCRDCNIFCLLSLNRNTPFRFKRDFYLLTIFFFASSLLIYIVRKALLPVIFQIELEFFFGFAFFAMFFCYLIKQFCFVFRRTSKNTERQSIRDGKDIHKCKHVIPFEFDAFLKIHIKNGFRAKNGRMQSERQTKIKVAGKKGLTE